MTTILGIKLPERPSFRIRKKKRASKDPLRLSSRKRKDSSIEEAYPEDILGLTVTSHPREDVLMVASLDKTVPRRALARFFDLILFRRKKKDRDQQNGRIKTWRNVVYHTRPIPHSIDDKGEIVAGLNRMFISFGDTKLGNIVNVLLSSVPRDVTPFLEHLERVKKLGNKEYGSLIDEIIYHALGDYDSSFDGKALYGRSMSVWGNSEAFIGAGKGKGAALGGWLLTYRVAGSFLHSIIHRRPMKLLIQPLTPLEVASPVHPYWRNDYYAMGDNKDGYRAFVIWKGVMNHEFLADLLDSELDLDIWVQCERVGNRRTGRDLFITVLLRTSSQIVNGKMPKIEETERRLGLLGSWHRVKGTDLRKAFRAFIPGSPPLDWLRDKSLVRFRHTIPTGADEFLHDLTKTVGGAGVIEGDSFLGFRAEDGAPYFYDRKNYKHILSLGKGERGKTTFTAALLALQETPYVFVMQLTPARGEGAMTWANDFGGDVLSLKLPDLHSQDEELEQLRVDEEAARKYIQEMAKGWWQSGQPLGLPLVVRPTIGSFRYLHYVQILFEEWVTRWGNWTVAPSQNLGETDDVLDWEKGFAGYDKPEIPLAIAIVDDNYGWPDLTPHKNLGDIPTMLGQSARDMMVNAVDGVHKQNIWMNVTTHSEEELRDFTPGFDESTSLEIHFKTTPLRHAIVRNPAKRDQIIVKLATEFPHGLLTKVQRQS